MDIRLSKNSEGIYLLELMGNLDLLSSNQLKTYIMKKVETGLDFLIVSLKEVEYINSAGIGALINIFSTLKKLNCSLILLVPAGPVLEALEMSRLTGYFPIVHSLKEALSKCK